jgi:hypothetical protein
VPHVLIDTVNSETMIRLQSSLSVFRIFIVAGS